MVVKSWVAILSPAAAVTVLGLSLWVGGPRGARAVDGPATAKHPATQKVEDNAEGWVWTGMSECLAPQMSGGGGHAGAMGSSGAYTFYGTGVQVYCVAGPSVRVDSRIRKMGSIKVSIDGQEKDSHSVALAAADYNHKAFEIKGLPAKNHVIEIHADGGAVLIDYLTVLNDPDLVAADTADDTKTPEKNAIATGDYALFPIVDSAKCIDVEGIKTDDGTNTMIHGLNKGTNQIWHITALGKDTYRLSPWNAPHSALTLLGPGFAKNGVPVVGIWTYAGAPNQTWKITSKDGQQFRLSPVSDPDTALGIEDGITKENNRIETYKFSNPGVQLWWVVPNSRL